MCIRVYMNLVLSLCVNYDLEVFRRFIGSLFDSCKDTNLLLFIGKNDEDKLLELMEVYDRLEYIIIETCEEVHVVNQRFYLYYNYLSTLCKSVYEYIFICDSRDVLFQNDIFKHNKIDNSDLYLFKEDTGVITIGTCKFNSSYVHKSGLDIFDMVKDKPIICVGTILGTYKGIMRYLEMFVNILENDVKKELLKYYGVDSAVNYKIVYTSMLYKEINIKVLSNSDNLVYTVAFPCYLDKIDYRNLLTENRFIKNEDEIAYCVHQYDRFPIQIRKLMSNVYDFTI